MSELPILPGCFLCGDPATNDYALQLVFVSDGNGAIRARWLHCPNFGSPVLPASAVVAHIAVGAAAILGRSIAEAARDALAWVLARDGERRRDEEVGPRA